MIIHCEETPMTTEKLYYENCRLAVFTARVLDCREREGGFAVLLDRTAFYPGGGGHLHDGRRG